MADGNGFENPWFRASQAFIDEYFTNLRRMARLPVLWDRSMRVKKGASPAETVYCEDRLKLLHYLSEAPPKFKTPLVFVFALVNRPYILDILPNKSVVSHFVKAGFDTYLVDWGVPTYADREKGLEDYVNGYMVRVVDEVRRRTGSETVSVLGYCMGGSMSGNVHRPVP